MGPDLPPECTSWLEANDIDTSGLAFVRDGNRDDDDDGKGDGKGDGDGWEGGGVDASDFISAAAADASSSRYRATPRAWQITEHDGRRTQVWRTPACPALYAMLRPPARVLPARYAAARAFHVGVHPERPDLVLLDALKASNAGALISVEPFTHAASPVGALWRLRVLFRSIYRGRRRRRCVRAAREARGLGKRLKFDGRAPKLWSVIRYPIRMQRENPPAE